ncbi:hypothetical protein EUTSA_v100055270mg, partial [Eutrema salsugineum]
RKINVQELLEQLPGSRIKLLQQISLCPSLPQITGFCVF